MNSISCAVEVGMVDSQAAPAVVAKAMSTSPPTHRYFMEQAWAWAQKAAELGETPIGAVLVRDQEIIAGGHNLRESSQRPTAHAEVLAIEAAAQRLNGWRLTHTRLYVTLEPCLMCWGAILLARIPQVIYGAKDPKAGVCGSTLCLHEQRYGNHFPEVTGGVLEQECGKILSDFFQGIREEKKQKTVGGGV